MRHGEPGSEFSVCCVWSVVTILFAQLKTSVNGRMEREGSALTFESSAGSDLVLCRNLKCSSLI